MLTTPVPESPESPPSGATPGLPAWVQRGVSLLGRYRLGTLLGDGVLGWAFAAHDGKAPASAAAVVVTVVRPDHAAAGGRVRRAIQRELGLLTIAHGDRPLATLVRPREPAIREERGVAFAVRELVDGPSLAELTAVGGLAAPEIARLGAGLAAALAELHAVGAVRCELRPADVRLRRGVEPVLLELGLARAAARGADAPETLAPEELAGAPASPAGDVFRLGALLRDLHAPPALDHAATYRSARRAAALAGLPPDLAACITRCLDPNPARRPSARALRRRLAPTSPTRARLAIVGALVVVAGTAFGLRGVAAAPTDPEPASTVSAPASAATASSTSAAAAPSPTTSAARESATPAPIPTVAPFKLLEGDVALLALDQVGSVAVSARGEVSLWDRAPAFRKVRHDLLAPLPPVTAVASGGKAMAAVGRDGRVWVWTTRATRPAVLPGVSGVRSVAIARTDALLLGDDGTITSVSFANDDGSSRRHHVEDGSVDWMNRSLVRVGGIDRVKAIAARGQRRLALRDDGSVWFWGEIRKGATGRFVDDPRRVDGLERIVAVASGVAHSLALDKDGNVWTWGEDTYGQLGGASAGLEAPAKVPGLPSIRSIAAGNNDALAVDAAGRVWRWGSPYAGSSASARATEAARLPERVEGLPPARLVASSGPTVFAATDDGLWAWGTSEEHRDWVPGR